MADESPPPVRARRWKRPETGQTRASRFGSYRFSFRLIGIPVLAVAGVYLYTGIRDRMVLPSCDSSRAIRSLSNVFKQLKLEPTAYAPITTVSTTDQDVVCSAVLPLPDGGTVAADYTFFWQGNTVNIKYSVARRAAEAPPPAPPVR